MRHFFLSTLLSVLSLTNLSAQNLYRTVYDRANAVVNNPSSNEAEIEKNMFTVTCLNYIGLQCKKRGLEMDTYFYDSQAVNLASFQLDFEIDLIDASDRSPELRKKVIECYRNATLNNPLFRDTEREKVMSYVKDPKTLTPFCIDTDWEKAYDEAKSKVKSILKK